MNTLDYAINMEHDGEKYYREQAEINKNNVLHTVCNLLAEEEKNHAQILENKKNKLDYKLTGTDLLSDTRNVFVDAKGIEVDGKQNPQLIFYRIAAEMEKKSIDLYNEFLSSATTNDEKELFEYMIRQEKQHFEILEEMDRLLTNAEEWIESPEFGRRREEY
jgi:rubrerythrin